MSGVSGSLFARDTIVYWRDGDYVWRGKVKSHTRGYNGLAVMLVLDDVRAKRYRGRNWFHQTGRETVNEKHVSTTEPK